MALFGDGASSVLYYLGLSGVIKYTVLYLWQDKRPSGSRLVGRVTGLNLYPVKSGRNVETSTLDCSPERAAHIGRFSDRHFMVVTDDNKMVTARQENKLLGIISRVEGSVIYLTAAGQGEVKLDLDELDKSTKTVDTIVHAVSTKGVDCGDKVSEWLTAYIQRPGQVFRMLYSSPYIYKRKQMKDLECYKPFTKEAKDEDLLAFQDCSALHLCTEESLADLNTRLTNPIGVIRFRPNIVVQSTGKAYEEDDWLHVFIGKTRLKKIKCSDRCIMPTINPFTCTRDPTNEPQKTLKSYRDLWSGFGPLFGIDLIVEKAGNINVGDDVYVVRTSET